MKKAPKKDRPGLLDDAARLAEAGRRGDKMIAHITPEEAALLKARGGSGTVNPRTGLLEFFEGSTAADSHGSNSSGMSGEGYGGGSAYGSDGGMGGAPSGQGGGQIADLSPQDQAQIDKGGLFSPSFFSDPGGWLGDRAKSFAAGLRDAPAQTIGNMALGLVSTPYAVANLAHGVVNSQNPSANMLGDIMTAATSFGAKEGKPSNTVGADETPGAPNGPDGFASDSRGGGGEGMGAPPRAFASMPQQSAEQVAQQALREAIVKPPQAYNTWLGNKMQIPQNPGTPRAYNTWAGNRFQIPGLLS